MMQLSKGIIDELNSENAPLYLPRKASQPSLSSLSGKTAPSTAVKSEVLSVATCAPGFLPTAYLQTTFKEQNRCFQGQVR